MTKCKSQAWYGTVHRRPKIACWFCISQLNDWRFEAQGWKRRLLLFLLSRVVLSEEVFVILPGCDSDNFWCMHLLFLNGDVVVSLFQRSRMKNFSSVESKQTRNRKHITSCLTEDSSQEKTHQTECVFRASNVKAFIRLNHCSVILISHREQQHGQVFIWKCSGLLLPNWI